MENKKGGGGRDGGEGSVYGFGWDVNDFFFSSRGGHTSSGLDWSSDVCSSDLIMTRVAVPPPRTYTGGCVRWDHLKIEQTDFKIDLRGGHREQGDHEKSGGHSRGRRHTSCGVRRSRIG